MGLLVLRQGTGLQLFVFPRGLLLLSSCVLKASLFAFPCPLGTGVGLSGQPRGRQTALRCLPRPSISLSVLPRALRLPFGAAQSAPCAFRCAARALCVPLGTHHGPPCALGCHPEPSLGLSLCPGEVLLSSFPLKTGWSGLPPCPLEVKAGGGMGHKWRFGSGRAKSVRFPEWRLLCP